VAYTAARVAQLATITIIKKAYTIAVKEVKATYMYLRILTRIGLAVLSAIIAKK